MFEQQVVEMLSLTEDKDVGNGSFRWFWKKRNGQRDWRQAAPNPASSLLPGVSLAAQTVHGAQTGTLTFPDGKLKLRAIKTLQKNDWAADDTFAGLTVLHSAPEPDLE